MVSGLASVRVASQPTRLSTPLLLHAEWEGKAGVSQGLGRAGWGVVRAGKGNLGVVRADWGVLRAEKGWSGWS